MSPGSLEPVKRLEEAYNVDLPTCSQTHNWAQSNHLNELKKAQGSSPGNVPSNGWSLEWSKAFFF